MGQVSRRTPRLRRRAQRGATLVEYALGVAVFVVATLGAVDFLSDALAGKADEMSEGVGVREPILPDKTATTAPRPTTTSGGGSTSTTSTTTIPSTTTTTAPPTTTATTAPSTTTTSSTTTTAPQQPGVSNGGWTAKTTSDGKWTATGSYSVTSGGRPVQGAQVTIRYRQCTWFYIVVCGSWSTTTKTTGSNGTVQFTLNGERGALWIEVEVTKVTLPNGQQWSGSLPPGVAVPTPYL